MAQSKRRTSRKSGKGKPSTPAEEQAQTPINGILIQLTPGEDGNQAINIQGLGTVKVTEIPTLLGLAKKIAEQRLGI